MPKLEEVERTTIGLYQEKIEIWNKHLTGYINSILKARGLKAEGCSIDLGTGEITEAPPEKKPKETGESETKES